MSLWRRSRYLACVVVVAALVANTPALATDRGGADVLPPGQAAFSQPSDSGTRPAFDEAAERAQRDGSFRAIVGLDVRFRPEGRLSAAQRTSQRAEIVRQRERALAAVRGTDYELVRTYRTVPAIALELSPEAIEQLRRSDAVRSIVADGVHEPTLEQSTSLIEAPQVWSGGHDGAGQMVAVLDTGVEASHPFFGGRVAAEACFARGTSGGSSGDCPNGSKTQIGPGAAAPCTYSTNCDHGTHVAGIAAGGAGSLRGVAPASQVLAIQVFSKVQNQPGSYTSDQIAALEHVYSLRDTYQIAAANLSLGGGQHTSACDGSATTYKAVVDNLASVGIATVVAAGNNGWSNAVSHPACISSVITVGSTTKSDTISSFSNSHATMVDLYAPGSWIHSATAGAGYVKKSGTSMAAPHVAGAWVLMKHRATSSASVVQVRSALRDSGLSITDWRDPADVHAHPRILVHAAATGTPAPDPVPTPATLANDRFADAVVVPDLPYSSTQITRGFTRQTGEPQPTGCDPSNATAWYRFTPDRDVMIALDTVGSDYDTVLAAYTGSAVNALSLVACDYGTPTNDWTDSAISFEATAGRTYHIQAGAYSSGGVLRLNAEATDYPVAVTTSGDGSGRVTSDPEGIDCGDVCEADFPAGSSVTLTATPDPGSAFVAWGGDCHGADPCVLTVDGASDATATFEPDLVVERFEESDGRLGWSGSWRVVTSSSRSGGSAVWTGTRGGFVEAVGEGPAVRWIGSVGPNRGIAEVHIDGVLVETVDLYAPATRSQQVLFEAYDLGEGPHVVRIVNTGQRNVESTRSRIEVDAIEAIGLGGPLVRFEESDGRLGWSGSWRVVTSSSRSGGSAVWTGSTGGFVEAVVEGPVVRWIGSVGSNRGIAEVYVDGVLVETVDLYGPVTRAQQVLFEAYDLGEGPHVVRIVNTGQRNVESTRSRIEVDAIEAFSLQ
jgi:subtilisin family serine protease